MAPNVMKALLLVLPLAFFTLNLSALQTSISVLSLLFIAYLTDDESGKKYRLPPGPRGLPIIGSLHSVIYNGADEYFLSLYKKYGKIVAVNLGSLRNIIVNDYETMKELSNHPDFQGRPQTGFVKAISDDGNGILDGEGIGWKHQRRFMMHSLRDSGMGKIRMEEKIANELEVLSAEIAKSNGKPMTLDILLEKATSNIIVGLTCNKTYGYDDEKFIKLIEKLNSTVQLTEKVVITSMLKSLSVFTRKDVKTIKENADFVHADACDQIREHEQSLDEDNPRDFIDLFLIEAKKDSGNLEYQKTFTEKQLQHVISDLFAAGTETSSTTIRWAILYMMNYPDIQKKVQKEIDDVTGGNRVPTLADKLNLPFTVATIQEVERIASIVPLAVPRSNPAPAKFREFFFPERCVFMFNVLAIHRDPKLWKNPEEFKPERFINDKGNAFRPPYLVPFGSGKRSCAGEGLAKMEVYLLFVTLMQKFTFLPAHGKMPGLSPKTGIIRSPTQFEVVAKPRQ